MTPGSSFQPFRSRAMWRILEMGNHEGMRKGFADMCSKVMIRR